MTAPTEPTAAINVSLKGATDPWVVIHAESTDAITEVFKGISPAAYEAIAVDGNFLVGVAIAAAELQGAYSAARLTLPQAEPAPAPTGTSGASYGNAPAATTPAPSGANGGHGEAPMGEDGFQMHYVSKTGKNGRPWEAWMSGAPQGFTGAKAATRWL